jgi:hypothetical protein
VDNSRFEKSLVDRILFFILHRGKIVDIGVITMGVVPGIDKLEDSHPGFGLGLEPAPVKEITHQGEETLALGIIEAVDECSGGRP